MEVQKLVSVIGLSGKSGPGPALVATRMKRSLRFQADSGIRMAASGLCERSHADRTRVTSS